MRAAPSRRLQRVLIAALAVPLLPAALLGGAAPAQAASAGLPLNTEYVALGDSFAAGPLILPQEQLDPCFRSSVDYAHLVAQALDAKTFRDVTCSSATTANVLDTPQPAVLPVDPAVPPQLDAVSANTTLVTLSIGANDIGLAQSALSCFNLLPQPLGTSCQATLTAGGVDRGRQLVDSVAPKIAATLDAVHAKAPHARILITSYGDYIQHDGCYPIQPVWPQDANYLQGLVDHLGEVTEAAAAAHHAEYVDFIAPGAGHDGCQLTQNWVNVVVPGTTLGVVPLHPTALGERNFARIIVAQLAGVTG
jgi:lysophospholipase L1-like esterase